MANPLNSAHSKTEVLRTKPRFFSLIPSRKFAYILLFLLIAIYIIGYTWMSWHLHATFITSADDLSNVDQVVWNSQHGRLLERTTGTRSLPRYGEHVEPIWIALGLLYFGWDDVRALLLIQTLALALGAVPVFWFARDAWQRDHPAYGAGLVFAALYLLNPFVSRANIAEVHATPFAVAPMLLALYWGWKGKWARVVPLVLLVLLVREDTGLLIIGFGGWVLTRGMIGRWGRKIERGNEKREMGNGKTATHPLTPSQEGEPNLTPRPPLPRGEGGNGDLPSAVSPFSFPLSFKAGLALIATGIVGVLIMVFGIIRTFADERFSGQSDSIFLGRYAAFGDSPLEIVAGMLTRWEVWAELFSDPYRLNFLRDFVFSTGGLGLFAPLAWLLFAPHLMLNLLSDYFGQYGSLQHYGAPLVPGMMVAAILGGARVLKWGRYHPAWRFVLLAVALGGAHLTARTATGQPLAVDWITPTETDHHRLLNTFVQQIPQNAPLSADPQLHPHLAHRHDAYRFPTVGDNAEWILVDVTTNTTRHPVDLKTDIEALLAGEWGIANAQDGYLLLQKGNPTKTIPPEFYTFARAATPPEVVMNLPLEGATIEGYTLQQDFWGRVAIEWHVTFKASSPADIRIDAALLTAEGLPITDTLEQPIPALVWQPPAEWQASDTYLLRTLPRHPTSPFTPALTLRHGDSPITTIMDANNDPALSSVLARQQNGWWLGGEWHLENNHAERGTAGWRRFEPPTALNREKGEWGFVELRAWEITQGEDEIQVTLLWHSLGTPAPSVQRFIHLVPLEGAPIPIAQADGVLGGDHPVRNWAMGEWVQETMTIPRPPNGNEWRVLVGLYDPATGIRFPVTPDAGDNTFELP
jgi:uncharacterized membrane protein